MTVSFLFFVLNSKECERLARLPQQYFSSKYLPYAISGKNQKVTLYKTQSEYCWSLLKPNLDWLRRFSFGQIFEIVETEVKTTKTLDRIQEINHLDVDIIKIDTQGLELPILIRAGSFLEEAIYVETETGFAEGYFGETTYAQIDEFMRRNNFLLFDINTNHRVARNNILSENDQREQILFVSTSIHFWRSRDGAEVDFVVTVGIDLVPV